jgi:hypothetical protein
VKQLDDGGVKPYAVVMGKKLNEAVVRLQNEAEHHTKLALAKQTDYENGFAMGFTEALNIAREIQQREN